MHRSGLRPGGERRGERTSQRRQQEAAAVHGGTVGRPGHDVNTRWGSRAGIVRPPRTASTWGEPRPSASRARVERRRPAVKRRHSRVYGRP
jgi:hypothetical protein